MGFLQTQAPQKKQKIFNTFIPIFDRNSKFITHFQSFAEK